MTSAGKSSLGPTVLVVTPTPTWPSTMGIASGVACGLLILASTMRLDCVYYRRGDWRGDCRSIR